jgi:hypothetical protein
MSEREKNWAIGLVAAACMIWLLGNIASAAWRVLFG